jgi:hypothetical protein
LPSRHDIAIIVRGQQQAFTQKSKVITRTAVVKNPVYPRARSLPASTVNQHKSRENEMDAPALTLNTSNTSVTKSPPSSFNSEPEMVLSVAEEVQRMDADLHALADSLQTMHVGVSLHVVALEVT